MITSLNVGIVTPLLLTVVELVRDNIESSFLSVNVITKEVLGLPCKTISLISPFGFKVLPPIETSFIVLVLLWCSQYTVKMDVPIAQRSSVSYN